MQSCASNNNYSATHYFTYKLTSNPPNAKIYVGSTPYNLNYYLTTPYSDYTQYSKFWSNKYFQARKEGYIDSKIHYQPFNPSVATIHFNLEPIPIKYQINTIPEGADIYWGTTENDLALYTQAPFLEETTKKRNWKGMFFQARKPGYYDSNIQQVQKEDYGNGITLSFNLKQKRPLESLKQPGDIMLIQRRLKLFGYKIPRLSGKIDKYTVDAIKQYQSDEGIEVDGIGSKQLLSHLLAPPSS